jgi:hypothetical protein
MLYWMQLEIFSKHMVLIFPIKESFQLFDFPFISFNVSSKINFWSAKNGGWGGWVRTPWTPPLDPPLIEIADKRDHSYTMFLTNVDDHNTNEKKKIKKIILHQMRQYIFLGSRRFLWVGRKGETNKILF